MARFDLKVIGLPELVTAFAALPDKLEQKVMQGAMSRAGKALLLPLTSAGAPVGRASYRVRLTGRRQGAGFRTYVRSKHAGGLLRRSFRLKALRRRKGRVGVLILSGTRAQLGLQKNRGYYPAHIELGHKYPKHGGTFLGTHYMKGALQRAQAQWLPTVAREAAVGLRQAFPG